MWVSCREESQGPREGCFTYSAGGVWPEVMSQGSDGNIWRKRATQMDGREPEGTQIPPWVADVVLRGIVPKAKDMKCAFILLPAEVGLFFRVYPAYFGLSRPNFGVLWLSVWYDSHSLWPHIGLYNSDSGFLYMRIVV